MSDVKLVMLDGISQHNTSSAVKAFIRRFRDKHNCQTLDLSIEYNEILNNLKNYITRMDYKNEKYLTNLMEIFKEYSDRRKTKMKGISGEYIFTTGFSPFSIIIMSHLEVIKREISKFHTSNLTIDNIMLDIHKAIVQIEKDNDIPMIYRIVTLEFCLENVLVSVERAEDGNIVNYEVNLYSIYDMYTTVNTLLCNEFLHLRCPEYRRIRIDERRLLTELIKKVKL